TAGTTSFTTTLVTSGVQTFTASGAGAANTSTSITVLPGAADRLLVVLPGESPAAGKYQDVPLGKTGTPPNFLAGLTIEATVYGVDPYYNIATGDSIDTVWA